MLGEPEAMSEHSYNYLLLFRSSDLHETGGKLRLDRCRQPLGRPLYFNDSGSFFVKQVDVKNLNSSVKTNIFNNLNWQKVPRQFT